MWSTYVHWNKIAKDQWRWGSQNEPYLVKNAYKTLKSVKDREMEDNEELKLIWNNFIPSKIQIHLWSLMEMNLYPDEITGM